jgi:PAT family beta-lactamase induction signal transducer AmpG
MTQPFRVHPVVWTALITPFGVVSGFVGVVLAFFATKRGLTVEEGASLIAIGMLPHTWKFLWAPVADMTLSRRGWYLLSVALSIVGIVVMAAVPLGPTTLNLMRAVIFVTNLASTTLGMAVEGLMAHLTPPEERGRAGGWFQAGNLGGSGVGGGLGLWMASNLPAQWMGGAVLGVGLAACAGALYVLPDVQRESSEHGVGAAVKNVVVDLWNMVRSKDGFLAALICFLPIGTGAATGVLAQAEIAAKWGAGEAEVGMVNGFASGFIAAFGCLVGGELCRRFPSRMVYAGVGALMAAVSIAMALAPATPTTFVLGGLTYSLVTGFAYAAFTGLVLETIGLGAAATKYNIFAALSNTPIAYMGIVLASAVTAWGPSGMLYTEAGAGIAGIILFFLVSGIVTMVAKRRAVAA